MGHEEVLEFLVDKATKFGISLDLRDEQGFSPLLYGKWRLHIFVS